MARTLDHIVDEAEFETSYKKHAHRKHHNDAFFVWIILVLVAVVGSHFVLNFSGDTNSMTGYVTASQSPIVNMTIMVYALFVAFIVILITGIIFVGITKKDKL